MWEKMPQTHTMNMQWPIFCVSLSENMPYIIDLTHRRFERYILRVEIHTESGLSITHSMSLRHLHDPSLTCNGLCLFPRITQRWTIGLICGKKHTESKSCCTPIEDMADTLCVKIHTKSGLCCTHSMSLRHLHDSSLTRNRLCLFLRTTQ